MTPELLASIAGSALSLALAYIPGLNKKYDALDKETKALVMGLLLIGTVFVVFGLSCGGFLKMLDLSVECSQSGAVSLLQVLYIALVANQATFMIAVNPFKTKSAALPGQPS